MSHGATIIIPTKDRPHGLRIAVTSALTACAHAKRGDILVVDDHSGLPAADSLADISADNLSIVVNERTRGPAGARNYGVDSTAASTILFLDDDDAMVEDYIARILKFRATGQEGEAVFGFCAVSGKGERRELPSKSMQLTANTELAARLFPLSAGVWTDRKAFLSVGGLDEELRINEDTDYCLKMAAAGYLPYFDSRLGVIINAGREMTGTNDAASITKQSRAHERELAFRRLLAKHQILLSAHPSVRDQFASRVAKYIARDRSFVEAAKFALRQPRGRFKASVASIVGSMTKE